jgi:hypothetical protein
MTKIQALKRMLGIQVKYYENVEYELRDKDGNIKPLFQLNALGKTILKSMRALGVKGDLSLYGVRNFLTGHWTNKLVIANLITNAGFAGLASRINGAGSEAAFIYIAVGTGTTAAAVTDTALEAEISDSGLSRASATASRVTTTVTNDTAQLVYTFSVTGTKAVTESGVLNAASLGTLLCRQVFSAINVVNTDNLQITWKIKAA